MIDSEIEMKELGRSTQMNIHNTRSLIRTSQACLGHLDILQSEEAFTVEEYKQTNKQTNTHTQMAANLVKAKIREKHYSMDIYPNSPQIKQL